MSWAARAPKVVALLAGLGVLAGCGGSAAGDSGRSAAPTVTVQAGGEPITVRPTQYCLDGDGRRYERRAPVVTVSPDTPVSLTVPDAVAEAGWSVQVFDETLEQLIGEVDVPEGEATYREISTSDVAPPTFYLVVVEDADPESCRGLAGAWPVGFIRAEGAAPSSPAG